MSVVDVEKKREASASQGNDLLKNNNIQKIRTAAQSEEQSEQKPSVGDWLSRQTSIGDICEMSTVVLKGEPSSLKGKGQKRLPEEYFSDSS